MSTSSFSPPVSNEESFNLEQALKQFSLDSERLEMTYHGLQERFKAVQSTLQESNTRLAGKLAELDFISRYLGAILNHMSQGILFIDLKGIVTTYNVTAQQFLQIPEKNLLFHAFQDFFEDSFFGFSLQQIFSTRQCPPTTFISLKQTEQVIELEVEATFVVMQQPAYSQAHPLASSTPQGLLILLRDITKIQRLQQEASRYDRLKELGELAAHLAHEIRNPLGGIKGFANILQQELTQRPDLQQMATYIAQGADELNQFVSRVLLYTRAFEIHLEMIDLMTLIEETRQLIQADAIWNSKINFIIRSPMFSFLIPLDHQLFKSALLNLFVNAVQAMPEGGILQVDIELDLSWVTIRIQDTGVGIASENLSKIFSPFFTTKQTGNGLGLVEVHKVVQAHHGSIDVQSEVGKGTLFTIKIPLKLRD